MIKSRPVALFQTSHNTFFLILYEMGMEDKDVRRIMGITKGHPLHKIQDSAEYEEVEFIRKLLLLQFVLQKYE